MPSVFVGFCLIVIVTGLVLRSFGKHFDNEDITTLGAVVIIAGVLLLIIIGLIIYAPEVLSTSFFIGCGLHCFLFVR